MSKHEPTEEMILAGVAASPKVPQGVEVAIEKALRQAFILGQAYWQRADSESCSQNRKSYDTLQKLNALLVETSNKFSGMAIVPLDALSRIMELAGAAWEAARAAQEQKLREILTRGKW